MISEGWQNSSRKADWLLRHSAGIVWNVSVTIYKILLYVTTCLRPVFQTHHIHIIVWHTLKHTEWSSAYQERSSCWHVVCSWQNSPAALPSVTDNTGIVPADQVQPNQFATVKFIVNTLYFAWNSLKLNLILSNCLWLIFRCGDIISDYINQSTTVEPHPVIVQQASLISCL